MKLIFAIAAGIILAEAACSSLGVLVLPFLLAYIFARIFRPVGIRIAKACRVRERVGCAVFAVLLCGAVVYAVIVLSADAIGRLGDMEAISGGIKSAWAVILGAFDSLPFHLFGDEDKIRSFIMTAAENMALYLGNALASAVGNVAKALPSFTLSLAVGAVSFVYMTADMDEIGAGIMELVPAGRRESVSRVFSRGVEAVFDYIRAYMELGVIVAAMLFVGFLSLGVDGALLKAVIISLIDALPVFGCGTILIPWGVFKLMEGKTAAGVGIIVLYGVIWIARQFLEPRLIGRRAGVNPFIMLGVMYLGLRLSGIAGMIFAIISLMVWKALSTDEG